MEFQFKKFGVCHSQSTMKVGTDALLLGAMADLSNAKSVLEIGTGCGIISLMLAQRFFCEITAIEIDQNSANQAAENFCASPWSERLKVVHGDVTSIVFEKKFDAIVSNPPYYHGDLNSPNVQKCLARHANSLSFHSLCVVVRNYLQQDGSLWLVLPLIEFEKFKNQADVFNFYCKRKILIRNSPNKESILTVSQWVKHNVEMSMSEFTIRNEIGSFTSDYVSLTKDFHIQDF